MSAAYETLSEFEPTLRAEAARRWLPDFCALMDPSYQSAKHTRILCDHLMAVERRDIDRLMVFMPPRHSKSYHVSQRFPAWYMGRNPDKQIILMSYGDDLAEDNSRKVRNLMREGEYPFRVRVADDTRAVNRWGTDQGGIVIAAGIKGALTGRGADVLDIDDPFKDREEADSESHRNKVWEAYTDVALTRLMPGGAIILTQTRWHEDDLAGRILNNPGSARWTVVEMPAIDDDGQALWPEWFDAEYFTALKEEIGTRSWNALYMQRPQATEGGTFKREWMARRHTDRDLTDVKFRQIIQTVDSSFKTGVGNDPSVIQTWGTDGIDYFLLDLWRKKVEFPELITAIQAEFQKDRPYGRPRTVLVEDTAAGQSALQVLRRSTSIPVIPGSVRESKEARAEAITPLFEAGKVSLPARHPLVEEFVNELCAFPTGRHDDHVDCASAALKRLRLAYQGTLKTLFSRSRGLQFSD